MAKRTNNNKSNKSWIFGTVLGAVAGAAYALWKTPMSGQELRGKLSPGPISTSSTAPVATSGGFSNKIMSTVERTLAPIVGVELGKTANGSSHIDHASTEPIAVNTVQADTTASNSLRARRFEWGSPAPETSDALNTTSAPETVAVEPNLPEAAPELAFTSADDQAESADYASATAPGEDVTSSWGTGALRSNRFASDDVASAAAPEPTYTPSDDRIESSEHASSSAQGEDTTTWGTGTLRSNRFAWGEAAPEAMTVTPSREVAPVEAVTPHTAPETEQASRFSDSNAGIATDMDESVIDPFKAAAAANSTGTLHPFPKLGGLEDNN